MSTVSTIIHNPSSFHPISRITFNFESHNTETGRCGLHLLYKLIPSVFIDPYELAQHQASYTFIQWGPTELEKPANAVPNSETNILLTINFPSHGEEAKTLRFDVDVPLHVRYSTPLSKDAPLLNSGNYQHLPFERPQAFFACPPGSFSPSSHRSAQSMDLIDFGREPSSVSPAYISASQLTEAKLTLNTTQFIYIPYSPNNPADFIRIPVGRKEDLVGVQVTTAAVVLLVFLWVGVVVIRISKRLYGSSSSKHPKTD